MKILYLAAAIVGAAAAFFWCATWWTKRHPRSLQKDDVILLLESFLQDKGGPYDWDDFLSLPIADPELESVQKRCSDIDWKTETGANQLREELERLKASAR